MDVWKLPHCGILGAAVSFLMEGMGDGNGYKRNERAAAGASKGTSVRTRTTLSIFRTVSGNKLIILEF